MSLQKTVQKLSDTELVKWYRRATVNTQSKQLIKQEADRRGVSLERK